MGTGRNIFTSPRAFNTLKKPPNSTHGLTYLYFSLTYADRARTASHPSLDSIREVDEEDETGSPRKVQGTPSRGFPEDFSDSGHGDGQFSSGLRRASKRIERVEEEDEGALGEVPLPDARRQHEVQQERLAGRVLGLDEERAHADILNHASETAF